MSAHDNAYNGWANYETWNVTLHINNDYGLCAMAQERDAPQMVRHGIVLYGMGDEVSAMRCDVCSGQAFEGFTDGSGVHVHDECMPALLRSWSVPTTLHESALEGARADVWDAESRRWKDSGIFWQLFDEYTIVLEKTEDRGLISMMGNDPDALQEAECELFGIERQ